MLSFLGRNGCCRFLLRSPKCKQQLAEESSAGKVLASLPDVARREEHLLSACLFRYDSMQWGDDSRGPAKEHVYSVQTQLHLSVGAGSESSQWFDE